MWPLSACPMLMWARLRRTMALNVSMMGTPATMSGMMSEVSAAGAAHVSSEMDPKAKPNSDPESPKKMLAGLKL